MSVNLSLFAGVGGQLFDNNGIPLAGGLIYTYAAGTTTPQATYTTSTGNIAHSNPIVLDSAGRVPGGEMWLTDGLSYKFSVFTSTSVLIGTYDNVNATFVAQDLANTSNPALGDALVGFRQSNAAGNFTGSVGKTVHQKFQEFISTADFGIPGNLTDDGNNNVRLKNAAFAAISANLPLKVIGRILVSDTVDWDTRGAAYDGLDPLVPNGLADNFSVFGENAGAGIYGKASSFVMASKPVIAFSTQARCGIFGLTIRLYDSTSTYTYVSFYNVTMLGVRSSDRLIIQDCRIGALGYPNGTNNPGAGVAISFDDCMSVQVLENDIQYVTKNGIFFSATGGAMRVNTSSLIQGNHFSVGDASAGNRTNCQALVPSVNTYIIGNVFENYAVGRAIQVVGDGTYIAGNWFEGNYDTILVSGGTYHTIIGNYGIGYNPALALIEATGGAVAGGVVAIANSDATSLRTSLISHITGYGGTGSQWQNFVNLAQRRNQAYPPPTGASWNIVNPVLFADSDSTGASSRTNPPLQVENLGGYFGLIASIAGANGGEAGLVVKAPSASSYAVMRFAAAGGATGENFQLRFGNWTNPSNTGSGTLAIEAGTASGIALVIYGFAGTRTVILDNITP